MTEAYGSLDVVGDAAGQRYDYKALFMAVVHQSHNFDVVAALGHARSISASILFCQAQKFLVAWLSKFTNPSTRRKRNVSESERLCLT